MALCFCNCFKRTGLRAQVQCHLHLWSACIGDFKEHISTININDNDNYNYNWASLVAQMVKNLPAVQETWVQFLGWEDLLEKEMATHSSILAWKIPWREEPGKLQSMQSQSQTRLSNFTSILHQRDQEGFLSGTSGKESACQCMRHSGSITVWGTKIPHAVWSN